jgi:hypothetical protein
MQEKQKTVLEQVNAFFTTRTLVMIIFVLLGMIATRLLGVQ